MTIRGATIGDRPRLIEMALAFLATSAYGPLLGAPPPQHLEVIVDQVLEHGAIFVAEDEDGHLVGMIALILVNNLASRALCAEELCWWVEPEHRGAFVGGALIEHAEQWAGNLAPVRLMKLVAPAGSSIGAFYEARGYTPIETAYSKRFL